MSGRSSPVTVRIKLLPVALLLIAATTVVPVDFHSPALRLISWSAHPGDVALNVLLFVPFGAALTGRRWVVVIALSGLLSCVIELSQLAQVGRHTGAADLLANMAGGLLGSKLVRLRADFLRVDSGTASVNRLLFLISAVVIGLAPLLAISVPGTSHNFSNWDSSYELAMNDELTLDRSWGGTLLAWAIYDRPLGRDTVVDLAAGPLPVDGSFDLGQLPANPVSIWQNPEPEAAAGFLGLGPTMSKKIHEDLVAAGTMSLLAWIRVKDLEQSDLERILTFSRNPYHRNFTLGQEASVLKFRLRTPATGLNGNHPNTSTTRILESAGSYFVAATYDGFVSRVFVDGELLGRKNLAARAAVFPVLHDGNLPLVLAVCGGCIAGGLIAGQRRNRPGLRFLLGCVGGVFVVAVVWSLGETPVWPVRPISPLWRVAPPMLGGLVAALSVSVGPLAAPRTARRTRS